MLHIHNITKQFLLSPKPLFCNFSIIFRPQEICIIIGNNGSGKSTLLRTIMGEATIARGSIYFDNYDITNQPSYKRAQLFGYVTQEILSGTVQELTLFENIALGILRQNSKPSLVRFYRQYRQQVTALLQELGLPLESYFDKPLALLSGGQRQIIALLMAIAAKPRFLLLDEYTSALDPHLQRRVIDYTVQYARAHNIGIIMVTHNLNDALLYGDRLVMLQKGHIVLDVSHKEKSALTLDILLNLFHQQENKELTSREQS